MRVKILRINLPIPFEEMVTPMLNNLYVEKEGSARGFEIYEKKQEKLHGRFIEKKIEEGFVIGPFGAEDRVFSIAFVYYEFLAWTSNKKDVFILIRNPPRGIKQFFNELHRIFGYGFSVAEVNFSILDFLDILKSEKEASSVKIKRAKVGGVSLNLSSSARIEVSSSENALEEVEKFLNGYDYVAEKIKFEICFDDSCFKGEVSSSGVISGSEEFFEKMDGFFEIAVAKCSK